MGWISLCDLSELEPGKGKYVEIDGFQLAVFLHDDTVYAMDNACPHAGGNLAGGYVENGCAICPWHYWAFRLDTGALPDAPGVKVTTYPTRLLQRDGTTPMVQADLPIF